MGFPNSRMIIINSQIFPSVGCLGRKIRLEDHYAASRRQLMDTEAKLREVQGQCYLGLVKNVENITYTILDILCCLFAGYYKSRNPGTLPKISNQYSILTHQPRIYIYIH